MRLEVKIRHVKGKLLKPKFFNKSLMDCLIVECNVKANKMREQL